MIAERTSFDIRGFKLRASDNQNVGRFATVDETTIDRTFSSFLQTSSLPSPRQAIRDRTCQVAKSWSSEEREARLRSGDAKRGWLLSLLDISSGSCET